MAGPDAAVACLRYAPARGSAALCDWIAKREGVAVIRLRNRLDVHTSSVNQAMIEMSAGWIGMLDNNGTASEAAPVGHPDFCSVLVK
ncbi:hypothetical protein [Streptomyces shenzhenensis]|uniref:hypothetical protein n=1 Tax=Streptomyces shenzhenensis TaxID=943815 RepID=UPI003408444D